MAQASFPSIHQLGGADRTSLQRVARRWPELGARAAMQKGGQERTIPLYQSRPRLLRGQPLAAPSICLPSPTSHPSRGASAGRKGGPFSDVEGPIRSSLSEQTRIPAARPSSLLSPGRTRRRRARAATNMDLARFSHRLVVVVVVTQRVATSGNQHQSPGQGRPFPSFHFFSPALSS